MRIVGDRILTALAQFGKHLKSQTRCTLVEQFLFLNFPAYFSLSKCFSNAEIIWLERFVLPVADRLRNSNIFKFRYMCTAYAEWLQESKALFYERTLVCEL